MPKTGRRGGFSHFRPCRASARLRTQKQKFIHACLNSGRHFRKGFAVFDALNTRVNIPATHKNRGVIGKYAADNLQRGYNKPNDCRCFFVFGKLFICLFFAQNRAGLRLCDFFDCNAAMRANGGVFVHRLSAVCAKFIAAPGIYAAIQSDCLIIIHRLTTIFTIHNFLLLSKNNMHIHTQYIEYCQAVEYDKITAVMI